MWTVHPAMFICSLIAAYLFGIATMCLVCANDLKRDE